MAAGFGFARRMTRTTSLLFMTSIVSPSNEFASLLVMWSIGEIFACLLA
jgi:hypothetical protein